MTQRSLNGTFKLQRSLTGTGILTSVLYGANNLSDVASATQARINLGLTGQLAIASNSTNYLTLSNPFGSTTNETLTVNATTNASPNSLVAYDANGYLNVSNLQSTTTNPIILNSNLKMLNASTNFVDVNGSNAITFDGIGNVSFGGNITAGGATINGILRCSTMQNAGTLKLANLLGYPTLTSAIILQSDLKFFTTNMHIRDANNNNTLTFDNTGSVTLYNTLSINGNSILLNSANSFYIQQQGLIAPGTQPYITIIGSNGNIGIGTSTASYKLDVGGSIRSTGTIYTDTFQANTINGPIQLNKSTFDNAGNMSMNSTGVIYTNYFDAVANFGTTTATTNTLYFSSNNLSSIANIQVNSVQNGNATGGLIFKNTSGTTTATINENGSLSIAGITSTGYMLAPNLYRTLWNQAINSNLSTSTLGTTFPSSITPSLSMTISTTVAYRLAIPFTWRGETYLYFRAYYQFFSTASTRNFNVQIWTYTNSVQNIILTFSYTNPSNYAFYNGVYTLSGLTTGQTYFVTLSDYTAAGSTSYTIAGGEISLGNN